ncbi:hypothetical protein KO500_16740, partial [Cellulophaga baltica]|nr:hypothetical protein [Cellulophaga baltica]MDO6769493.1 hypothetical protein [Cellulophaga sp. 1_MG-2023]
QEADEVTIEDTAGNFTSTDVEGALTELANRSDETIYVTDGTLTADRTVNMGGNNLDFDGVAFFDESTSSLGIGAYANTVSESTFHSSSDQTGNGAIETGWVYTQAIEAVDEKGGSSAGIILGDDNNFNTGGDELTFVTDGAAQMRVSPSGATNGTIRIEQYGDNTMTGTATTLLGVESDGDIVEVNSLKASKIFYPPSIAVDASTNGTFTIDLYDQYVSQYGSPAVASAGAPAAIPTYGATELYYYVTYADPTVFGTMTIDANGTLSYEIVGQPSDYNSLINVVFVVK